MNTVDCTQYRVYICTPPVALQVPVPVYHVALPGEQQASVSSPAGGNTGGGLVEKHRLVEEAGKVEGGDN